MEAAQVRLYFDLKLSKRHCPIGIAKFRLPEFHVTPPNATKYTTLEIKCRIARKEVDWLTFF